jgi:predicted XRE-type DNA-binding protein
MKRKRSPHITAELAAIIKHALLRGLFQHQIAAILGINQGRVSEIKTGKFFPQVNPAANLPPAFG